MLIRLIVLALVPLACAACANDAGPYRLGSAASAAPTSVTAVTVTGPQASGIAVLPSDILAREKTVSDKIFAAIALERVTGRKPDPGRLIVEK